MESHKSYYFRGFVLLAGVFLICYYLLHFGLVASWLPKRALGWNQYLPFAERLSLTLFTITAILLAGRIIERFIDRSGNEGGVQYNLIRLLRLVTYMMVAIVGVSFLFQNLYAAAVSFGIISLVLGFALQSPITSFIAWLYIIFRHPYHVGDRIQLGELRGVVLEISYLDTLIREFNGAYLGNDADSGRLIHFPNSIIMSREVINYSGKTRPFIRNETALQIAFTSDLDFVEACLLAAANQDMEISYADDLAAAQQMASRVYFRVNRHAWLEAVISYPAKPTDLAGRRNRLLRIALPRLNAQPGRVQFPQGSQR